MYTRIVNDIIYDNDVNYLFLFVFYWVHKTSTSKVISLEYLHVDLKTMRIHYFGRLREFVTSIININFFTVILLRLCL